jgi:hypothetical protein
VGFPKNLLKSLKKGVKGLGKALGDAAPILIGGLGGTLATQGGGEGIVGQALQQLGGGLGGCTDCGAPPKGITPFLAPTQLPPAVAASPPLFGIVLAGLALWAAFGKKG